MAKLNPTITVKLDDEAFALVRELRERVGDMTRRIERLEQHIHYLEGQAHTGEPVYLQEESQP